jgi:hypothetical protein
LLESHIYTTFTKLTKMASPDDYTELDCWKIVSKQIPKADNNLYRTTTSTICCGKLDLVTTNLGQPITNGPDAGGSAKHH